MSTELNTVNLFENGAIWLRADFHLHTIKDKEFKFDGIPTDFFNQYVQRLKEEEINICVITNHNKFDKDEYANLRKKAIKDNIWILPGVELSVNDGSNGVHCLIVFDNEQWLVNGEDFINQFLTSAFEGIQNRENENMRCKYNLDATLAKLNEHRLQGRNAFVIMAHVDQKSGFFEEFNGGRIEQFAKDENFRRFVLAFQKFRTYDKLPTIKNWFEDKLPAFVEGSDCKSIDQVGKAHQQNDQSIKTFVKIGAFNFDALMYALLNCKYRLTASDTLPKIEKAYLKTITFTTSRWKNKKVSFNPGMNNLIGIRGSGKSTLLETVRYALDIPIGNNSHEPKYKERLIQNFLGSGGKMEVELVDKHGNKFIAERIYGESPNLYEIKSDCSRELKHSLKINAIIHKPLYYGQKDLSDIGGETSTEDLINKLMGDKLNAIRQEIEDQNVKVINLITEIKRVDKQLGQKEEIEGRKASIEKEMKVFKELEIDKKLNKQIEFNKDSNRIEQILAFQKILINEVNSVLTENQNSFANHLAYESKENAPFLTQVFASLKKFQAAFFRLSDIVKELQAERNNVEAFQNEFNEKYEELKEEFSKIKRAINLPNIEADTYVKLSKDFDLQNAKLVEIEKLNDRKLQLVKTLTESMTELKNFWHKEFLITKEEIDKLNAQQLQKTEQGIPAIKIEIEFKGNKDRFREFLSSYCRGSGMREPHYEQISEYADLIEVYNDFKIESSRINQILSGGNTMHNFRGKFLDNINVFLTYRVPDKYTVFYKGRPLQEHSLGQRASALIIFILTLKENDLIIIDQPEDDLDNQTIYLDVISELIKLKDQTQFVFATHNPNIPVLGDSEQVISCSFKADTIGIKIGSIDSKEIQKNIVDIMEGGDEAFNLRKMIYELWKH